MKKDNKFKQSLQAHKEFVKSKTNDELQELMKPFDNMETEQCDIHSVVVPKGTLCGCGAELIKDVVGIDYCGNTLCKHK